MMYWKTWLAWLYIILNGMTVLQPHLLSKMFSFIFSFHLVATVILSHCTSCRFSFHVFSCCCSGRMNFSMADLKVDMAFCSFLVFLPEKYYFPAFSFASSPPLKPRHFFHDHYLLYEWIHFYIIWKDFRANLFKKKSERKEEKKETSSLGKIVQWVFFPLNSLFLASHLCVTYTELYDKSSNLNQFKPAFEIPFATPLCTSEKEWKANQNCNICCVWVLSPLPRVSSIICTKEYWSILFHLKILK